MLTLVTILHQILHTFLGKSAKDEESLCCVAVIRILIDDRDLIRFHHDATVEDVYTRLYSIRIRDGDRTQVSREYQPLAQEQVSHFQIRLPIQVAGSGEVTSESTHLQSSLGVDCSG